MLDLHSITKTFDGVTALDDVSMSLSAGRVTGFVGANGAGKSTTMRIIMGLAEADSGGIRWQDRPITPEQRRRFGYMPEERGLYAKQRIGEQLVYFGRLHGMTAGDARTRAAEMLEAFGLTDRVGDRLEKLSLGNQQRVQIAVALMHQPDALILDEPFSGLDPAAVDAMAALIRGCADDGVPVLFSSHQLDLVERLCDELVVISAGRVVAAGTAEKLRAGYPTELRIDAPGVGSWIDSVGGVEVTARAADSVVFTPVGAGTADVVLREATRRGTVSHFAEQVRPLSEIYREVTR